MAKANGSYAETNIEMTAAADAPIGFVSGTRLATGQDSVVIESLNVGDLLLTTRGVRRPIRRLGHRTIDCRQHRDPGAVAPVRIAAHTFGKDRPARDLHVAPAHAICIDVMGEILIPAGALANGRTITTTPAERVTYWHVELDSHDIVLAENLPAESDPDTGNRDCRVDAKVVMLDAQRPSALHIDVCRPLITEGPLYALVRDWVERRAGVPCRASPHSLIK